MAVVVGFTVAGGIPHCIHILHAEIEVFGIVGSIYGVGIDNGIFVFTLKRRSDVARHALANEVVVGPVGECIVGATLVVGVGVSCEFSVHCSVRAILAVRIHTVEVGGERAVFHRNHGALSVGEFLFIFHPFSGNGKGTQFGRI